MSELDVDVAVVGAGPAGSVAAMELAKRGVKVLVLEKRQEIGAPKRCAEGINVTALNALGLGADGRWAVNEINGAVLYSPSMKSVTISSPELRGYILERKMFEKHLAAEAVKAGARYMVKTTVTDVIRDAGGKVAGVKAEYMGEEVTVHSKVVIAADGVDSMTAKRAGIDTVNHLIDYHSGFQYEMAGVSGIDERKLHIFFGNEIAPKGYVWIFPKGNTVANVGIGIVGVKSEEGNRARDYLDRFIKNNPRFFGNASPIEINSGGIPVSASADTFVGDGIMAVGDAAQQVNPIHGGGIALAMSAARIAADVTATAISEGDTSRERLEDYETRWREADGARMRRLMRLRTFLERLEDSDVEKLADILQGDDLMKLIKGETTFMLKLLATKAPKMLPLARKFLGS